MRHFRALAVCGAVFALLTLGTASASARIVERDGKVTQSYDTTTWDWNCGYPMHVAQACRPTRSRSAVDTKDPRIVFVTDNFQFRETRSVADGRSFAVEANGLSKDVRAKLISGSLYEFTFHNSGQPFTIRDSSGRLVSRDRGTLRIPVHVRPRQWRIQLRRAPELGTTSVGGRRRLAIVAPLVGSGSASHLTPRFAGSTSFPMGFYEYLPPSYHATARRARCSWPSTATAKAVTGSAGAAAEPAEHRHPAVHQHRRLADRPAARRARHAALRAAARLRLLLVRRPAVGRVVQHAGPARPRQRPARVLHHARRGPRLHRLRRRPLQRRPQARVRHRAVVRRVRRLGVPREVPRHVAGCRRRADRGRWPARMVTDLLWPRVDAALDVQWRARRRREPTGQHRGDGCARRLRRRRQPAKKTIYPDLFHDGWDQAYSGSLGDDIYSWMLGYSLP